MWILLRYSDVFRAGDEVFDHLGDWAPVYPSWVSNQHTATGVMARRKLSPNAVRALGEIGEI